MMAMDAIEPTPAPTLRQILRFQGIETITDANRRRKRAAKERKRLGQVRGIEVQHLEPEIVELSAAE